MLMMLHAAAAMKCGHHRTHICTVDTDVMVVAIWAREELPLHRSTCACCMSETRKVKVTSSVSCIHWMQYDFRHG